MNDGTWRVLPLLVNDGPTNMAIDEAIMISRSRGMAPPTVRLYQWSPSTVTIGRHQAVDVEVDREETDRRGFQLVRRISGGGAVLHAEGREVTYAVVARKDDPGLDAGAGSRLVEGMYATILRVIQRAVNALSARAVPGVIHCPAVLVDGKKISGNAQCIKGGVVLQHGTVLLSVEPDVMYSVLKPPAGVDKGRMVRSVRAKVTGLDACLGRAVDPAELAGAFTSGFEEELRVSLVAGTLSPGELALAGTLRHKYASDAWTVKH